MGDGVRGGFGAVLAALRVYRRLGEEQRTAAAQKADTPSASAAKSPARRSVVAMGEAIGLVVAAVVAISLGVTQFGHSAPPRMPYAVGDPPASVPATSLSAVPLSGGMSGPALVAPPVAGALAGSDTGTAAAPSPGVTRAVGVPVATSSPSNAEVPVATDSAPVASASASAAGSASPGVSPTLIDLCRTVAATGNGWPSVLKSADRATVIAAAGSKKNVPAYCAQLLANSTTQ